MLSLKARQHVMTQFDQCGKSERKQQVDVIFPCGIINRKINTGKTVCPFQLWDRVQPTHLYMNKRSWCLTWRGGSHEGPRKAKPENYAFRSKTRFLWSFQSKSCVIHSPYNFYMLYLVGETPRCSLPVFWGRRYTNKTLSYSKCWARGLCKVLRDPRGKH